MRDQPERNTLVGRPGQYLAVLASVVLAFIAVLAWIGTSTGAILLPTTLAMRQEADRDLVVLPSEIRHWAAFKLPRIAAEHPDVVIVGSSRGNEVRSAMFRPYKLYNGSLTCWSLGQMLAMVDHLTRIDRPAVIILSLDYFMFSDVYAASVDGERTMYFNRPGAVLYQSTVNLLRSVSKYPSLWTAKIPPYLFGDVPPRADGLRFLGLDGIRAEAGFRWDGSFLYEGGTLLGAGQRTAANKGLIDAMPGNPRIEPQQWAILERIADLGRQRGTKIVAVQWPILKTSLDYLDNDPSYHPYAGIWRDFRNPATAAKMRDLGIDFYDVSGLAANDDSRNFIDAAHANEAGMLNAMIALGRDPRFQATFPQIDGSALQAAHDSATKAGNFADIYKEQF